MSGGNKNPGLEPRVLSQIEYDSIYQWLKPTSHPAYLLRHSPDGSEAFPEDNKHSSGPTPKGGGGTVEGSVPSSKDDDISTERRERTGT